MATNSASLEGLSIAARFLRYSDAYLESARVLCAHLRDNPNEESYARACACMFNARLSVELFLKAALVERGITDNIHHHMIEDLAALYAANYTEQRFAWNVPFITQVIGADGAEADALVRRHLKRNPPDQALRYPVDRNHLPWDGYGAFEAKTFLVLIKSIQQDFARLSEAIFPSLSRDL